MSAVRVMGRILAVLIIITVVISVPLLLLADNSQRVLTGSRFVEALTDDVRTFQLATAEAAEGLARGLDRDAATRDLPVARLNAEQWHTVLSTVAPPASLQAWTRDALEAGRRWARGGTGLLDEVVVPYTQMRDNLVNDPDQVVLRTITEAQPACAAGMVPSAAALIPDCRPEEGLADSFYADMGAAWRANPDEVWRRLWPEEHGPYASGVGADAADLTLAELLRRESRADSIEAEWGLRFASWALGVARAILLGSIVIGTLLALGLIALLAARNGVEALRWTGSTLVLVAAGTATLGFLVWLTGWSGPLLVDPSLDGIVELEGVVRPILRAFSNGVGLAMAWQAGVVGLIGALAWLCSFFLRRPRPATELPGRVAGAG